MTDSNLDHLKKVLESKPALRFCWRSLKFALVLSSAYFFVFSDSDVAFLIWSGFFVLSLSFLLSVKSNPFLGLIGLILSPVTVLFLIGWFAIRKVATALHAGVRI